MGGKSGSWASARLGPRGVFLSLVVLVLSARRGSSLEDRPTGGLQLQDKRPGGVRRRAVGWKGAEICTYLFRSSWKWMLTGKRIDGNQWDESSVKGLEDGDRKSKLSCFPWTFS